MKNLWKIICLQIIYEIYEKLSGFYEKLSACRWAGFQFSNGLGGVPSTQCRWTQRVVCVHDAFAFAASAAAAVQPVQNVLPLRAVRHLIMENQQVNSSLRLLYPAAAVAESGVRCNSGDRDSCRQQSCGIQVVRIYSFLPRKFTFSEQPIF